LRANAWRLDELRLILAACLLAALGVSLVSLGSRGVVSPTSLLPAVVLAASLLIGWLWLRIRCGKADQVLFPLAGILSAMGIILVFRLEPDSSVHQLIWMVTGITLMLATASFPRLLGWLKRYKYTWMIAGIGLVALTLVFGVDPNGSGARLWLGFGENVFQPSEMLKVLLVVFLAGYVDDKREIISYGTYRLGPLQLPALPYLAPMLAMWGLSILLLLGQKDLGATFLLFAAFLAVLYMASSRLIYVWGGLAMFLVAAYGAYHVSNHVATRVDVWLNPWVDSDGKGYQIIQSLLAFASGGIFGTGLAKGYPKTVPAVHTDFPLAAIGEELGLLGTLGVLALYLLFVYRGFKIALEARNTFSQMLAAGVTASVGIQTLIIAAGNIKLIPLTGITLPFISYGGSSLVTNFIIVGLLLRISQESAGAP